MPITAGSRGKRRQREELAIAALLSEPTIEVAAERAGVPKSTLLRWMAEPFFREQYWGSRRAVVEAAIGRLQRASTEAIDALTRNLTCGTPAVEVGAAKAIFELTAKGMEQLDFAERLAAIGQVLGSDQARGPSPRRPRWPAVSTGRGLSRGRTSSGGGRRRTTRSVGRRARNTWR